MALLATSGRSRYVPLRTEAITLFPFGTIDTVQDLKIPSGAASASSDWLSKGDRIELRGGQNIIGSESISSGEIQNQAVAERADGTQILYRKNSRKLEYFNTANSTWTEVGTNFFQPPQ